MSLNVCYIPSLGLEHHCDIFRLHILLLHSSIPLYMLIFLLSVQDISCIWGKKRNSWIFWLIILIIYHLLKHEKVWQHLFDLWSVDIKSTATFQNWLLMEELKLKRWWSVLFLMFFSSTTRGFFWNVVVLFTSKILQISALLMRIPALSKKVSAVFLLYFVFYFVKKDVDQKGV